MGSRSSFSKDQAIRDRLILEIQYQGVNDQSSHYTQREMEIYLLIKQLIEGKLPSQVVFVTEVNWTEQVSAFEEDMFILQESQSMGRLLPGKKRINKANGKIGIAISKSQDIKKYFSLLDIEKESQTVAISNVLQIIDFRESKSKFLRTDRPKSRSWIDSLKDKYFVRYYKSAKKHVPIYPNIDHFYRKNFPFFLSLCV